MGACTLSGDTSDLLYGLVAIGAYLRMSARQAKHRARNGDIPTFKVGRSVCARKGTLDEWLSSRELAQQSTKEGT